MPRPPGATVKSLPASVAGGNPRAVAEGAGPALPLFAPTMTTTATPNTIMARIGTPTRITQPRNSSPARNSLDQLGRAGWGSRERSSVPHSAAAPSSGRAVACWFAGAGRPPASRRRPGRGTSGPGGPNCRARSSNSKPGLGAGPTLSDHAAARPGGTWLCRGGAACPAAPGHAGGGPGIGWPTVDVYLNRLGSPLAGSRPGRSGRAGRWPAPRYSSLWPARVGAVARAARGCRPSNSYPGTLPASPSGGASPSGNRDAAGCGPVARGSGAGTRGGRRRRGPSGPRASSSSGWLVRSLVTCALLSRGRPSGARRPG